jgi:integrase
LGSKALHAVGKAYQKPKATAETTAAKYSSMRLLLEHCKEVRWARLRSVKNGEPCSQVRLAEEYVEWVGPALAPVVGLGASKVDEYVMACMVANNSGSTINRKLSAISVLLRKAVDLDVGPRPFTLPWQKEGESRKRYYTPDEERQILDMTLRLGRDKLHAFFEVLIDTAMRPKELRKLPWRDIGQTMITVDGQIAKNATTRRIPLAPRARAAIERMRAEYGDLSGPFFAVRHDEAQSFWRKLRGRLKWMDDTTVIYVFRHTCISRWANNRRLTIQGISQKQIAMWCGHTMRVHESYVHQIIEDDEMAGLVEAVYGQPTGPRLVVGEAA